jgi:hypothetical protein
VRCLFSLFLVLVIALAGVSSVAQSVPTCKAGPASTIDDRDGVTARVVSFQGSFGKLTAHVFIPDTAEAVAGIAFSHSSIQYADSRIDLLPFARAMARAGAASIMIDGTIDWQIPNDDSKRPWEDVNCAAQWLTANANLDRNRLAFGGPITEGGDPFCPVLGEEACGGQAWFYFNFGSTTAPHGISITELMKTPQGQLRLTELPGGFHLKPVKLEWLMDNALPTSAARR